MRISDWISDVCSSDLLPDVGIVADNRQFDIAAVEVGVDMLDRPLIPAGLDPLADPGGKHRVPVMAISDLATLAMDRDRLRLQQLSEHFALIARHRQQLAFLLLLPLPHLRPTPSPPLSIPPFIIVP